MVAMISPPPAIPERSGYLPNCTPDRLGHRDLADHIPKTCTTPSSAAGRSKRRGFPLRYGYVTIPTPVVGEQPSGGESSLPWLAPASPGDDLSTPARNSGRQPIERRLAEFVVTAILKSPLWRPNIIRFPHIGAVRDHTIRILQNT